MRKTICILCCGLILTGCVLYYLWFGTLYIKNCTDYTLRIITNAESCEPNMIHGFPGTEFDIPPGGIVQIAETKTFSDESMVTIENFIKNHKEAYITILLDSCDVHLSKTWTYEERHSRNKQFFNLNNYSLSRSEDNHYRYSLTYMRYTFDICEDDLRY